MKDWSAGYMSDIDYTYGYFRELNPLLMKTAMLNSGLSFPEVETACELGFGQGISTNIHAAASNIEWYGTDFNPAQASFAKDLAAVSGSDAKLYDDSFMDFCNRSDLPDFDYICLHGIWSWISAANRQVIVDFVRKKLKVGGVLYISYNTLPGWANFAPLRHLMAQHVDSIGSAGQGIVSRIDGALEFADELLKTEPRFAAFNPKTDERLKKVSEQNKQYVAHEYFNEHWEPMYFSTFAQWLAPAKVDFACSAYLLDNLDAVYMNEQQRAFLNKITDSTLRQSTRDFMINQQFRKEYWVKGPRRLSGLDKAESLQKQEYILMASREDVSLKLPGTQDKVTMNEEIYNPILDIMSNHQPVSIEELKKRLGKNKISIGQIIESINILSGSGQVMPVQNKAIAKKLRSQTDKLNNHLIGKARSSGDIVHLASPVVGGGVSISRFNQLFVGAFKDKVTDPAEMAQSVWETLKPQKQRLIKDGKSLTTDAQNIEELTSQAKKFVDKRVPLMKSLSVL